MLRSKRLGQLHSSLGELQETGLRKHFDDCVLPVHYCCLDSTERAMFISVGLIVLLLMYSCLTLPAVGTSTGAIALPAIQQTLQMLQAAFMICATISTRLSSSQRQAAPVECSAASQEAAGQESATTARQATAF